MHPYHLPRVKEYISDTKYGPCFLNQSANHVKHKLPLFFEAIMHTIHDLTSWLSKQLNNNDSSQNDVNHFNAFHLLRRIEKQNKKKIEKLNYS